MVLPAISLVYQKTKELVSCADSLAYLVNLTSIKQVSACAQRETWTPHQQRGCAVNTSANIKADVEHDLVTTKFIGMDESHRIAALSGLFGGMAQTVKDARNSMLEHVYESFNSTVKKTEELDFGQSAAGKGSSYFQIHFNLS